MQHTGEILNNAGLSVTLAVILGFILDAIFGDPASLYHPVILIGKIITQMEKITRRIFPGTKKGEIAAGAITSVTVLILSFGVPFMVLYCVSKVNIYAAFIIQVFWCFQIPAGKSLKREAMRIYRFIKAGDIKNARKYLGWIVGRDTENLEFKAIEKAVIETVAENTADGVTAPLFYMLIGGAPLGFLYKGVNTLDSMVAYRNEKYINFGLVSAKIDDLFNWIPARITGIAMIIVSPLIGLDGKNAARIFKRDRRNHKSPNSAMTEAPCAGALDIELAGDAFYFGELYKKKTIGDPIKPVDAEDIKKATKLMTASSILLLVLFSALRIAVYSLIF